MIELYRKSPYARFVLRTLAVAVISYFVSALAQDSINNWHDFLWGAAGAVAYAAQGLLTGTEPFVGIKSKSIEVPTETP